MLPVGPNARLCDQFEGYNTFTWPSLIFRSASKNFHQVCANPKLLTNVQTRILKKPQFYHVFKNLRDFYHVRQLDKTKILQFAKEKYFFDLYYNYKYLLESILD